MRLLAAAAILALGACESISEAPTALSGQWGGQHVGVVLEGGVGRLEYDCASGTIDQPVIPAPDGRFTAAGTHIPGQGGPVRVGQIFTSHRATYAGRVEGEAMTLTATLEDGTVIGPYTLTRGAEPQLVRCL